MFFCYYLAIRQIDIKLNDRISLVEIHRKANLVSLEQRRCFQLISLLYQHSELNENVFEIPARNTRAVNRRKYRTEMYHNIKYKNSPYYKGAKFWDTLPRLVIDSQTLMDLKRQSDQCCQLTRGSNYGHPSSKSELF